MRVALWSVSGAVPERLPQVRSFLEAELEDWIKRDATLVLEGLRWIGQQVRFPDRSAADLVGITKEGQLVVAELKRDMVNIAALAQALYYTLWLGSMSLETLESRLKLDDDARSSLSDSLALGEVDMSIMLIGTAREPELDRAAAFLAARGFNIPVKIVTFTPFVDATGGVLLAREVEDHEQSPEEESTKTRSSRAAKVEWVQERARNFRVAEVFSQYIAVAAELGLGVKPWPKSITIVPRATRGRTLLYISPTRDGTLHWGYSPENLTDLYGAEPAELQDLFGENWVDVDAAGALDRLQVFQDLMTRLQRSAAGLIDPANASPPPPVVES